MSKRVVKNWPDWYNARVRLPGKTIVDEVTGEEIVLREVAFLEKCLELFEHEKDSIWSTVPPSEVDQIPDFE